MLRGFLAYQLGHAWEATTARKTTTKRVPTDVPVIGLTGALGSGCSTMAGGLAAHHGYLHVRMSDPIRAVAKEAGVGETGENLQDIGDAYRQTGGRDILARIALDSAAARWSRASKGVVVDGIRNVGEVDALRQHPNFYLVSVQADRGKRLQRLVKEGRFTKEEDFGKADERDADERTPHGQQVRKCNDLADVVVVNDDDMSLSGETAKRDLVDRLVYSKYATLFERLAKGELPKGEHLPSTDEALMTAAYCEAQRSPCLKRQVGAVITSGKGTIVASGHNAMPPGSSPCLMDPDFGGCARDQLQETLGRQFNYCPSCGTKVTVTWECPSCNKRGKGFRKQCGNCEADTVLLCVCRQCRKNVLQSFLPGTGQGTGKLLDVCRALHGEEYALANLLENGGRVPDGAVLYTTTFPCNLCANRIAAAGIESVVYAEPYEYTPARRILEKAEVKLKKFQGVKSRAYFRLYGGRVQP